MTPADDAFHPATIDDPFWTETIWLGFAVEDLHLSGAIYPVFRPSQGVTSLGIYLWDDTGHHDQDCLYFQNYWHLPLPDDLRSFELPYGFSHRCIEPLRSYEVHYDDNVELALDLRFDGVHEPVARTMGDAVAGLNQSCRVTGTLRLNGDLIDVDCHELRARSWASRPDARWPPLAGREASVAGYSDTYATSADLSFVIGTAGTADRTVAHSGFVRRDGELRPVVSGVRTLERSPDGYVERVTVDLVDDAGRELHAEGVCVNHFLMQATPGVLFWVNGTRWTIDGTSIWGSDHDVPGGRVARHVRHRVDHSGPRALDTSEE